MSRSPSKLPSKVTVQAGLELEPLWERFELFEALHHNLDIATPMSSEDLDQVVASIAPSSCARVLDVACGRGELLRRINQRVADIGGADVDGAEIDGVGIDLSPWMMAAAADDDVPGLQWILADAKSLLSSEASASQLLPHQRWDVVCCLGASWIWYGLKGTIRAVAELVSPGGTIAIGDMHVRPGVSTEDAAQTHGRVDSLEEIDGWFATHGVEIIDQVSTSDDDWAAYHDRVEAAASSWQSDGSGNEHDKRWLAEAHEWRAAAERDREVLTWSVWIGRRV